MFNLDVQFTKEILTEIFDFPVKALKFSSKTELYSSIHLFFVLICNRL